MKKYFKLGIILLCFTICNSTYVFADDFVLYDMNKKQKEEIKIEPLSNPHPTQSYDGTEADATYIEPRKVIGDNSMFPIHSDISKLRPYSKVCYIETHWNVNGKDYYVSGTGTMIGKNTVLTAGHCVYNPKYGLADDVYFSPGMYMKERPFGRIKAVDYSYPKELEKLNYDDSTTSGYQIYDIAILHSSNNIGLKCGYESIEYIPDSEMLTIPSNQLIINGYPKAGVKLSKYDEKTNSNYTVKGVMYSAIGYNLSCNGRRLYYDVDTEAGMSGAGLRCYSMNTQKDTIVGINIAHPNGNQHQYNIGVHIDKSLLTWITKLIK